MMAWIGMSNVYVECPLLHKISKLQDVFVCEFIVVICICKAYLFHIIQVTYVGSREML
jgi:hypothetical protein